MTASSSSTALVLVDVIASFFDPSEANYYPDALAVLEPIAELLAVARKRDTLVVHAVERHYPGLDDFEFRKLPRHHLIGDTDAARSRSRNGGTRPSMRPISTCFCVSKVCTVSSSSV
mgnify:CR=1 FL=1